MIFRDHHRVSRRARRDIKKSDRVVVLENDLRGDRFRRNFAEKTIGIHGMNILALRLQALLYLLDHFLDQNRFLRAGREVADDDAFFIDLLLTQE